MTAIADCLTELVSTEPDLPKISLSQPTSTNRRSVALRTEANR